jgi:hypothetical protein
MLDNLKPNTEDGLTSAYAAAQALQPIILEIKRGTPGPVQRLIECAIPLRPIQWWNELNLHQLKLLAEHMHLCSEYTRMEIKTARELDLKLAEKYSRLANAKIPVIRSLQVNLQLNPAQLYGALSRFNGSTKAAQQVQDILTDVTDLYAH